MFCHHYFMKPLKDSKSKIREHKKKKKKLRHRWWVSWWIWCQTLFKRKKTNCRKSCLLLCSSYCEDKLVVRLNGTKWAFIVWLTKTKRKSEKKVQEELPPFFTSCTCKRDTWQPLIKRSVCTISVRKIYFPSRYLGLLLLHFSCHLSFCLHSEPISTFLLCQSESYFCL